MRRTATFATSLAISFAFAAVVSCTGSSAAGAGSAARGNAHSAEPVLAATPPMGFNTWNRFHCNVSDSLVRGIADAMVSSGMKAVGYQYVVIDDCWQVRRDSTGQIVPDPQRFPHGMKALADYVHSKGLKFGLYTDAGDRTCQGRPGSYGHEVQDARTYASWGVDYVKVDWCHADSLDAATRYTIVRNAFRKAGRPMVLSICEWGLNRPWEWADTVGQLWRTTDDIEDNWQSMIWNADANARHQAVAGPGHWNDPDMLEVGNGGMTLDEYRAHFSLWAIMAAPLIAGNDLRHMSEAIRDILTNREVIAVDQDPLGVQGGVVFDRGRGVQVWAKPLSDGSAAVLVLNERKDSTRAYVRWRDVGLKSGPAEVRDLWAHKDLGVHTDDGTIGESFRTRVPGHGAMMFKITPVKS